ncbi:GNAT family N-acetyltransferase [Treponema phagedenis]|uniref:Acetyltransferase, GNAT family n=1 Tax=Treponema phagedenis TaxID=162 RepID=A0A0B7GYF5_TREPH|nr:GNAT family N-acetyltransferase [Treponema phagedenis]EFW37595.1 acetyltransferase, GNAT family [Treponema phagedenis F0421]NVP24870.1 GNAT family N-acetyltransferase [Treponema phagedenis]QEK01779.1 GNAT family N-acetyltransferase [Treponema phagedenis]QEK06892.1 GNAT family N-acetyltransferase [Treponema phagedenis]QKS93206.1 GNAT family N-acetyltransferase [Treponema phagedenis]
MTIRECTVSDAEPIFFLNRDELGYDFYLEGTKENIEKILQRDTDKIFVAEDEGKIVGYVHANNYELLFSAPMKNIMSIAVSPKHRGKGIGRKLLAAIEDWAKKTGAHGIRLVSSSSRTDAHRFYQSCGYEKTKEQFNLKKLF